MKKELEIKSNKKKKLTSNNRKNRLSQVSSKDKQIFFARQTKMPIYSG